MILVLARPESVLPLTSFLKFLLGASYFISLNPGFLINKGMNKKKYLEWLLRGIKVYKLSVHTWCSLNISFLPYLQYVVFFFFFLQ